MRNVQRCKIEQRRRLLRYSPPPTHTHTANATTVLTLKNANPFSLLFTFAPVAQKKASGVRIRVLVQDYPNTPGLAIKDYWGLGSDTSGGDDKYVVLVADDFGGKGNLLNFNVSPEVDLLVSPAYFSRLSGKYGTKFYVRDKGEDIAIMDAVEDLAACLVGEEGMCSVVKGTERK